MNDDDGPKQPLPPYVRGRPTSRAAAESMRESAVNLNERVYDWGNRVGPTGWTDEECEIAAQRSHQCISARRRTLYLHRRVVWTGKKRRNRTKRNANVWVTDRVATQHGIRPVPLPVNQHDRLAFIEMHCTIRGPDGMLLPDRASVEAAMVRFYGEEFS